MRTLAVLGIFPSAESSPRNPGRIEGRVQHPVPVRRLGADLDPAGDEEEHVAVGIALVTQVCAPAEAMDGALRGEPVERLARDVLEEGRAGHHLAHLEVVGAPHDDGA